MRENYTRWTCNRCSRTEETTSTTRPQGWAAYGFSTETNQAALDTLGHLCRSCTAELAAILEPVQQDALARGGVEL